MLVKTYKIVVTNRIQAAMRINALTKFVLIILEVYHND